jgi:hypothetical protein
VVTRVDASRALSALIAALLLVSCDTGEATSETDSTTKTSSVPFPSNEEVIADEVKRLRAQSAELIGNARRLERGQRVVHKPALLGIDFYCDRKVEPEISVGRGESAPLIDARFLFREACRRLRIAEREAVLGRVEPARRAKALAEARLATRYARAAQQALTGE